MGSTAFVFPGQGSQYIGMGRALSEISPAAARVFAEADGALGERLSDLAWSGDPSALDRTENAQPAILATSIAYLRALQETWASRDQEGLVPVFSAGHSMGQYSALVAAGVIDLGEGIRLVRERGRRMQASGLGVEGAMAAVIGLDDARLAELEATGREHGTFAIANRNSPGQVVVSGERAAVQAAADVAKSLGARRAILLPVSVAAHSPLMAEAAQGMRAVLEPLTFRDPTAPLLANADAHLLTTGEACRGELVDHLTSGVDWVATVRAMVDAGVTTFLEIGPGKVLTGLIKRIEPDVEAIALDDPSAPGRLDLPEVGSAAAPAEAVPTL